MTGGRAGRRGSTWIGALLVGCALLSVCWLVLGVVVAVAREFAGVAGLTPEAVATSDGWTRGLVTGMRHS